MNIRRRVVLGSHVLLLLVEGDREGLLRAGRLRGFIRNNRVARHIPVLHVYDASHPAVLV